MPHETEDLIGSEHFRFHVELFLELVIVDPRIAGSKDEYAAVVSFKGQRFCNACALDSESESRKLDRCAGDGKLPYPVLHAELTEICTAFFD